MLSIGEMNKIPNQTEFLVFNCRYLVFFSIQNTNVSVGISFSNIISDIGSERERDSQTDRQTDREGSNEENNQ